MAFMFVSVYNNMLVKQNYLFVVLNFKIVGCFTHYSCLSKYFYYLFIEQYSYSNFLSNKI